MATISAQELARVVGDWHRGGPRYADLADGIAEAIDDGRLPTGLRLPAERALAGQFGVSRNTVVAAYDRLRTRRLVRTRQGSGTAVAGRSAPVGTRDARVARTLLPNGIFAGFLRTDGDAIDLRAAHWIGTDELPRSAFTLDDADARSWISSHGYFPGGIRPLREAFATRLTARGLPTSAEQIIVTSGAQQALSLVVGYAIDPGDGALVEDPTYPGVIEALRSAGANVTGVPRTAAGVDLAALRAEVARRTPRLVYVIPTAHNPLGTTLRRGERTALLGALRPAPLVVEDLTLADTELTPSGEPPLAADAERTGGPPVVSVGSLSKSMWGGLRIGWLRAPLPLVQRLTHLKAVHDIGSALTSQVTALRLLAHADEIRERRIAAARQRLAVLQEELRRLLPMWSWEEPGGGLALWVRPGEVNGIDFAAFAHRHGVAVAPGTLSSPVAAHTDRLRISFGQPPDVLREGVARLAAAWADYTVLVPCGDPVTALL